MNWRNTKMPITKTNQIKSEGHFHNAIKYILNPDKTNEQVLTSGYKISNVNNAEFEMNMLRRMARQQKGNAKKSGNEVLAHHIKQAFDPKDKLTPEEIHEIGRKTALALTDGHHEFVIATHVDRDHIHNHIIFNNTSSLDLKKFRWQKGTPELLRNISDKITDYHQGMTLPPHQRQGYSNYQKYLALDSFRPEIKKRLNFLLRNSMDIHDLLRKAQALDLEIDFSGKHATYKLLDEEQQRPVRDSSLEKKSKQKDKPLKYSMTEIEKRLEKNELVFGIEQIKEEFDNLNQWVLDNPDLRLEVEPWQIDKEVKSGLYIHLKVAGQFGTVKIPNVKFNKLDNGNFEIFVKQNEKLFFLDDKKMKSSKKIYGASLIKQLSNDSGIEVQRRNRAMENIQYLANAWALLESHQIAGDESFENLGEDFVKDMEKVEAALDELNDKIMDYHEAVKYEKREYLLSKVQSLQVERDELQSAYDEIAAQFNLFEQIKEMDQERSQNSNRLI